MFSTLAGIKFKKSLSLRSIVVNVLCKGIIKITYIYFN